MTQYDDDLQSRWQKLEDRFRNKFNKEPDLETILMLVGMQELRNTQHKFNKEEKQDLMHIATCTVLAQSGYYNLTRYDEQGWPYFELAKPLPELIGQEQEDFIKDHVLLYFENMDREWNA